MQASRDFLKKKVEKYIMTLRINILILIRCHSCCEAILRMYRRLTPAGSMV